MSTIADLFQGGTIGAWWDCNDLSTLYQDAAGTIPVTGPGQPVGRMEDKSGNGNHLTAPSEALRPILGLGATYYLRFDASDAGLQVADSNLTNPASSLAVVVARGLPGGPATNRRPMIRASGPGGSLWSLDASDQSINFYLDDTLDSAFASFSQHYGDHGVSAGLYDSVTGDIELRRDGATLATHSVTQTFSATGVVRLGFSGEGDYWPNALYAAVVVLDSDIPTHIGTVESGLTDRLTTPTVGIYQPIAGVVKGTIVVMGNAVGMTNLQYQFDGVDIGYSIYGVQYDTTTVEDGPHTLTATAVDSLDHTHTSAPIPIIVDNTAPTVAVTAPVDNALLGGTVTLKADAADAVSSIASVQFQLDDSDIGAAVTAAPWQLDYDISAAAGAHSITAIATDAAGHSTESAAVAITIDNTAPMVAITAPAHGSTVSGVIPIAVNVNDASPIDRVDLYVDDTIWASSQSPPFTLEFYTTTRNDGPATLTVIGTDAAGNEGESAPITVTIDNTAPTVAVTAPADNARLRGTVMLNADAADAVSSIASVQFQLDGAAIGAAVTAAPWQRAYDTRAAADGAHSITAIGTDAAGNHATSAPVAVSLDNYGALITIIAPTRHARVQGQMTFKAAVENPGGDVSSVRFQLDGIDIGEPFSAGGGQMQYDTVATGNGVHQFRVIAAAGGQTITSAGVTFTVANAPSPRALQFHQLLPPGRALGRLAGTLLNAIEGWVREFTRLDARAQVLQREALPNQTDELLPDWERVAGLPDACTPPGQTFAARRAALVGKLSANSAPTAAFLEGLALSLGYTVTIVDGNTPYVWEVHSPETTVQYAQYGSAVYGDLYAIWGNTVLECVLSQYNPAHCRVLFIYE